MKRSLWSVLGTLALVLCAAGCGGSDGSARMVEAAPGLNGAVGLLPEGGTTAAESSGGTTGQAVAVTGTNPGTGTTGDVSPTTRDGAVTSGNTGDAGAGSAADGGEPDAAAHCEEPLAADVRLDAVVLNQGVRIPLVKDGEDVQPRNAPVVQGRGGLLRAFVTPLPDFAPHPITAKLTLRQQDGQRDVLVASQVPVRGEDADLASTFNFELDGEQIDEDTHFQLELLEDGCVAEMGDPSEARYPVSGDAALLAEHVGPLRVTLVPIAYETQTFFGNTRVWEPNTSERAVARYRDALMAFFPVEEVIVRVREPLAWDTAVDPWGAGWGQLLDAVLALRQDEAESGEYYYGLLRPGDSAAEYCQSGCVAGLAPVPPVGEFYGGPRATGGLGLGFNDAISRETLVHELGHAHGRNHIRCGDLLEGETEGIDDGYSYATDSVGVWGYDILNGDLKDPEAYADMMGYCEPIWISDYTYERLAEWASEVNGSVGARLWQPAEVASQLWRSVLLLADGSAQWGAWRPAQPPRGRRQLVGQVLNARGIEIDRVEVRELPLSDSSDRYLFVPEPGPEWHTLRVAGVELDLSAL